MRLERLWVEDFRNISSADLSFDSGINILWGDNAQGKTNVLDAVYLLAHLNSFRERKRRNLIRKGSTHALVKGEVVVEGVSQTLGVGIDRGQRRLRVDNMPVAAPNDYFRGFCVILFSPDQVDIVRGSPSDRRKFADRAAFRRNLPHFELVRSYNKVLKSRNRCLKEQRFDLAEAYQQQLAELGAKVAVARMMVVEQLDDCLQEIYTGLTGTGESISIEYVSRWADGCPVSVDDASRRTAKLAAQLDEAITSTTSEERKRGHAVVGPHTDDVVIGIDEMEAGRFASQGQVRSILLALIMAEYRLLSHRLQDPPVVLLDDLSSELDASRRTTLLEYIRGLEGQVLVTTTDLAFLGSSLERAQFHVEGGKVVRER
jgi:DNA replication and repair protein RecF